MIVSWNVNKKIDALRHAIGYIDEEKSDDILLVSEVTPKMIKDISGELSKKSLALKISNQKANSYVAAIFKEDVYFDDSNLVSTAFEDFRNQIFVVHNNDMYIIGAHPPVIGVSLSSGTNFWDSLIELRRIMPKDIPAICVGDFNTYIPGTVNKRMMYRFMAEGFVDFWIEKGNVHNAEVFPEATTYVYVNRGKKHNERLDYVLVTGKDFDKLNKKYDMTVDHTVRVNGLSDHSAIILKEKTPETKKTGELK